MNALERSLSSRNRLLEDARADTHWLEAIEHETAQLAFAVAAMRSETVTRLQAALAARGEGIRHFRPPPLPSTAGWRSNF